MTQTPNPKNPIPQNLNPKPQISSLFPFIYHIISYLISPFLNVSLNLYQCLSDTSNVDLLDLDWALYVASAKT